MKLFTRWLVVVAALPVAVATVVLGNKTQIPGFFIALAGVCVAAGVWFAILIARERGRRSNGGR